MRRLLLALPLLLCQVPPAAAQVSVGIGVALPGVSIGINVPAYPRLVPVPGVPVYVAPAAGANLFFYDGLYWVYVGNAWYASGWYDGPWRMVAPLQVPVYLLRVPVRYYPVPPPYFHGWRPDAPPRWDKHWGRDWAEHRRGWDRWDRRHVPAAAPLPEYQRDYSGDRYPRNVERQRSISSERYGYTPREPRSRREWSSGRGAELQPAAATPAPQGRDAGPPPGRGPAEARGPSAGGRDDRGNSPGKGQGNGQGHGNGRGPKGGD